MAPPIVVDLLSVEEVVSVGVVAIIAQWRVEQRLLRRRQLRVVQEV
jgi:hypothetical protein